MNLRLLSSHDTSVNSSLLGLRIHRGEAAQLAPQWVGSCNHPFAWRHGCSSHRSTKDQTDKVGSTENEKLFVMESIILEEMWPRLWFTWAINFTHSLCVFYVSNAIVLSSSAVPFGSVWSSKVGSCNHLRHRTSVSARNLLRAIAHWDWAVELIWLTMTVAAQCYEESKQKRRADVISECILKCIVATQLPSPHNIRESADIFCWVLRAGKHSPKDPAYGKAKRCRFGNQSLN